MCTTGLKALSIEEIIAEAQRMQLQGLEIWSGHIEDYLNRGGKLGELHALLAASGLFVPAISEYTYFTKGPEACKEDIALVQRAAEWAKALECPRIRTFAGHIPSREATSEQWDLVMEGLYEALQACKQQEVALAIEIHNNTLADTEDSLQKLMTASSSTPANVDQDHSVNETVPNNDAPLELIYDGFNLFVDHFDQAYRLGILERFYPVISHVHFKDYHWNHEDWSKGEAVSVLQGDAGHAAILDKLLELQYTGFISLEYFNERVVELVQQSLAELSIYIKERAPRTPSPE
ncbi:Inosose dehydratase [compost metagenome]